VIAMRRLLSLTVAASLLFAQTASAFCGFYVATSDTTLINKSSRVVLAHDGDTTLVTMASDVAGDPKEFGLVVPVPEVIKREQVKVIMPAVVQHLADYTKPRLVEYFDDDPCAPPRPLPVPMPSTSMAPSGPVRFQTTVKIEAQYSVEEYDIIVLTATKPADLVAYLNQNGYHIPPGAEPVIGSYLTQGMHFFLAKVNMAKMKDNTSGYLRPIQVTYQSPKFMLPIRLGTVNSSGPQDMIVLGLTRKGRLETTNYRTVKVPSDAPIPLFVQDRFGEFYDAMFDRQVSEHPGTTFLEYAWNLGFCDPCSSAPMSPGELITLGVTWTQPNSGAGSIFVTRLHVRYDRERFPEDLTLHETADQEMFQARYVMTHPFKGTAACDAGAHYMASLPDRYGREADSLQKLTGWDPSMIRGKMRETGEPVR
jgi:hypothetical protein